MRARMVLSPVLNALFSLYERVVEQNEGEVLVANYPSSYTQALVTLGLMSLPHFNLVEDTDTGIQILKGRK